MWKQHEIETTFTYNEVTNIQYSIEKGVGYRERAFSLGENAYFGPIRTDIPHATPNYGPGKSKFEMDYYRQTFVFQKNGSYTMKI